jgi:hypothetical protein
MRGGRGVERVMDVTVVVLKMTVAGLYLTALSSLIVVW